jgi:hypothetical protein
MRKGSAGRRAQESMRRKAFAGGPVASQKRKAQRVRLIYIWLAAGFPANAFLPEAFLPPAVVGLSSDLPQAFLPLAVVDLTKTLRAS